MSASMPALLEHWLARVRSHVVSLTGETAKDADMNMLIFSLSDARACGASPGQLDEFLIQAYRHFSRTLWSSGKSAWFYVWHDEMSGTLRSSICEASDKTQLPFACRLNVVAAPTAVSAAALESLYGDGIPASEFAPKEVWEVDDDDDEEEYTLTVFARPLLTEVGDFDRG